MANDILFSFPLVTDILLDHEGVIKFVDFGAAKVLAKNTRTVQRSRRTGFAAGGAGNMAGMVGPDGKPVGAAAVQSLQGTPMYMSPEVIKGENKGRRGAMDVWSLGCVVLEFATGRRPWSQLDNEWAIMFHIGMAQQHPPLPEPGQLSEQGIDFIRQCLMIDPYDRPSAAEMREHPWIQDLVEQLNAAAIEEDATSSMADGTSTVGINSVDYPASTGGGGGGGGGAGGSGGNSALSSLSSSTVPIISTQGHDSAAGVAAMAATPATRSINSFIASRPPTGF
jgi:mitogen-activated protein kinase kinase kinase